ncbi:MAG: DUF4867 family protein [Eubacteriales bacterium]|nr:DUF4867 family protein [Eubacteriales bacterium]
MDMLQTLRQKNPGLSVYSVFDPAFRRYGRVVAFDSAALIDACENHAMMPEAGSRYVPVMPELEALPAFENVRRTLRGEGGCQIGCCWGYNTKLNCLEYHRASEHNIAVSDLLLLLAAQQDLEGFELAEGKIVGFYVPKGTTIEVYATTLHFCPCQTADTGFRAIVILPRGTNLPLEGDKPVGGDGRLLWAKDKWLIAHPENTDVIERGAYPGLHGVNFDIKY